MGIYYNTFLCYGFFTSNKNAKKKLSATNYIEYNEELLIFGHSTSKNFGEKVIFGHTHIKQNIKMDDIKQIIGLEIPKEYFNIGNDQKEFVAKLSDEFGCNEDGVGLWIVQSIWCTLESNALSDVCKKFKVIE